MALVGVTSGVLEYPSTALVVGLLCIAIALRRISWPLMSLLGLAAALVQVLGGGPMTVADVAYFPLFVALGGHWDQRVRGFGLAASALAIAVAAGWMWQGRLFDRDHPTQVAVSVSAFAALVAAFTLGGWVTGFLRWQRAETLTAAVDARLAEAEQRRLAEVLDQEAERARIAADMHDVVAHSWAVVAAQADGARYALHTSPDSADVALSIIGETARSAIGDMRRLLTQLRDRDATKMGLDFENRSRVIARMQASGMLISSNSVGEPPGPGLVSVTAHRILREALTNALKYGSLDEPVVVSEDWTEGYRLRVINTVSVRSSPFAGARTTGGHGLVGMAESVAVVGGTLVAERRGDTWVVEANIRGGA